MTSPKLKAKRRVWHRALLKREKQSQEERDAERWQILADEQRQWDEEHANLRKVVGISHAVRYIRPRPFKTPW